MNSIYSIVKKIKNLLPYFLLIAIYFFFVNLEARKDEDYDLNYEKENNMIKDNSIINEKDIRIKIPVIPYN